MNSWRFIVRRRIGVMALMSILVLLAACGPAPLGTGWAAVSLFDTSCGTATQTNVMVAFSDRVVLVNPVDGKATPLLNSDCEPRPAETDGKAKVWEFKGSSSVQFYTTPVQVDAETLLATSYTQHMIRVDIRTAHTDSLDGSTISGYNGHTVANALLDNGTLYLGLSSKDLVALDAETYDRKWAFSTGNGVWTKPLLSDGVLYFSSLDHYLYAVDAATGQQRWKVDLGGAAVSTPLLQDGVLYIGTFSRKIHAISLDGQIVNSYDTQDWVWGTPVISEGVLYTADLVGNVYALDVANGLKLLWTRKVAERAIRATPVITDKYIIVGSRDHFLYWLNKADGSQAMDTEGQPLKRDVQGEILADVLLLQPSATLNIPEPYILVSTLSTSQVLVAYTLERGQFLWTYGYS